MLTPLILFLGLTVATAVIAYWSDNLGKKLGKKRVSLFGLRPRITATVLTVTSSWAIMLFTLAVLLAVVTPLRNALFRYDRERAEFRKDISKAETRLSTTQNRLSQTQNSLLRSNGQLEKSQLDLRKANSAILNANRKAKQAVQGAKQAQQGQKTAQIGAKKAQRLAEIARNRAETARNREKEARSGEKEARSGEREAQRSERQAEQLTRRARLSLAASLLSLRQVQADFRNTRNNLSRTQIQLRVVETRLTGAQRSYRSASTTALRLGPQILNLGRETVRLTRQRDTLQKQIAELEFAAQIYQQAAVQLAGGNVNINVGKTFAARIIEAGESEAAVEAQLREILIQGQKDFAEKPETEPLYSAGARLILLQLPERGPDNGLVLRELAQLIAANGTSRNVATSVRLVAKFNFTAEDKQIAVQFIAVPVAVAFRAGETLASATIENSGDALIFRQLNELIETAREEAIKRKVNPPLSPEEPNFYAEGTSVGLFEALRRIETSRQAKRVRLVAAQELSTVEPLRVRFEVENVPTS